MNRPILFREEGVRAILRAEDPKTHTRRLRGLDIINQDPGEWCEAQPHSVKDGVAKFLSSNGIVAAIKCPYGKPGDNLWVRETWACGTHMGELSNIPKEWAEELWIAYKENYFEKAPALKVLQWRPSIHMPRWAYRILLEVTDIRVERVQGISEEDCIAEGISGTDGQWSTCGATPSYKSTPRKAFLYLWDSINDEKGFGWEQNPFCWVISFKRLDKS